MGPASASITRMHIVKRMNDLPQPPLTGSLMSSNGCGARLGPWELLAMIGSGGMGEVWLASRSDGLYEGRAAIKLLRAAAPDASTAALLNARFAREGELLARLAHPHITQLQGAGLAPDGTRYLVLEYVQGKRIDHWCDARRLDVNARLRLLLQLCEAVAFAHANLIVHRDLKPANIFVTQAGHVKLLDFGVAKLLENTPENDELTREGSAGLTPEYAAPEQVNGGTITVATDVYALGVLMFKLLSGQRPYDATGNSAAQLARAIVEAEPRRLGASHPAATVSDALQAAAARSTSPQRLRQQLRGDLEHITAKALRKHPRERYASAQALADDIRRHLNHESVSAQAPTWRYLAAKFMQRHTVGVTAGAVVAVAIGGGVVATLWQASVAREQAALASLEAANATAIKDFLLGVFNTAKVGDGKTMESTTARDLLLRGGERLLGDQKLAPPARLELLGVVASLQNNLGLVDAAAPLEREALVLARAVHGPRSQSYVRALTERGLSLAHGGETAESDRLIAEAVALIEQTGLQAGEHHPIGLRQLGLNALRAGNVPGAMSYLKRSTAVFDAHQPRHAMRASAHRWLGKTHLTLDDFPEAERELRRSIELSPMQDQLRDFGVGAGRYSLGELFMRSGRFQEAEHELEEALAINTRTLGPRHHSLALVHAALARVQHQVGRTDAARTNFAAALAIAPGDASPQVGNVPDRVNLALAQFALDEGRLRETLSRAEVAASRWKSSNDPLAATVMILRGEALSKLGRHDDALAAVRAALATIRARSGNDSLSTHEAQVVLGEIQERRGLIDEARLSYAEALATSPRDAGSASPTQTAMQARARLGTARLALASDAAGALRRAREAQETLGSRPTSFRDRLLTAQAQVVEAQALASTGQLDAARRLRQRALDTIALLQTPESAEPGITPAAVLSSAR